MIILSTASTSPCLAQSQGQMNEDAERNLVSADKKLNSVYNSIIAKNAKNPLMTAKLKHAQKAWIDYKDAMIDLQYPVPEHGQTGILYGSAYQMCTAIKAESLTKKHTELLSLWLSNPYQETDVCLGNQSNYYEEE